VQKAEQLLASTNLSIAEIALQAGFDSIPSFNRIYRKIRNCAPSQYRAKCRSSLVS
jgi:transcriptional regulator GlxA family with amidase domain